MKLVLSIAALVRAVESQPAGQQDYDYGAETNAGSYQGDAADDSSFDNMAAETNSDDEKTRW